MFSERCFAFEDLGVRKQGSSGCGGAARAQMRRATPGEPSAGAPLARTEADGVERRHPQVVVAPPAEVVARRVRRARVRAVGALAASGVEGADAAVASGACAGRTRVSRGTERLWPELRSARAASSR